MNPVQIPADNTMQILPEGIIELKQTGYQTKQSIAQYQAQIDDLTAQMHRQGKKVFILVDVSGVTGQEPEVLAEARQRFSGDYDAMALFGTSSTIQMILNWMMRTFGKNDHRIKLFSDRDQAIAWLLKH
jgi:hypothetical protein